MLILKLLELFIVVMVLTLVITQVVLPAVEKRMLFPFFRKQHKLENKLVELNQYKIEKSLENEIKSERKSK